MKPKPKKPFGDMESDWDQDWSDLEEEVDFDDEETKVSSVPVAKPFKVRSTKTSGGVIPWHAQQGKIQPSYKPQSEVKVLCKHTAGNDEDYNASTWVLFFDRATKETHKLRIDQHKTTERYIPIVNRKVAFPIFQVDDQTYMEINNRWKCFYTAKEARRLWDTLIQFGFEYCTVPHRVVNEDAKNWH